MKDRRHLQGVLCHILIFIALKIKDPNPRITRIDTTIFMGPIMTTDAVHQEKEKSVDHTIISSVMSHIISIVEDMICMTTAIFCQKVGILVFRHFSCHIAAKSRVK